MVSAALAAGLLLGGASASTAATVTAVTVDRPSPKERPGPGERPDPRCDRAEQGLARAKADVKTARQRLKAAPKKKKPARRAAVKSAKQTRASWKARVSQFC
jgi:hypothetical protein